VEISEEELFLLLMHSSLFEKKDRRSRIRFSYAKRTQKGSKK
jgi:hypothetical protein